MGISALLIATALSLTMLVAVSDLSWWRAISDHDPIFHRHCEARLRRSNPSCGVRGFGLLRSPDGALRRAGGSQWRL